MDLPLRQRKKVNSYKMLRTEPEVSFRMRYKTLITVKALLFISGGHSQGNFIDIHIHIFVLW